VGSPAGGVQEIPDDLVGVDADFTGVAEDPADGAGLIVGHRRVDRGVAVQGEEARPDRGVGVVIVFPGEVVDLPAAPDQAQELGFADRVVEEDDPVAVERRLELLVALARGQPGDLVDDPVPEKVLRERLPGVRVADDAGDPVLAEDAGEPVDGRSRVDRRRLALIEDPREDGAPLRVLIADSRKSSRHWSRWPGRRRRDRRRPARERARARPGRRRP
jgi:hypothetical protein